MAIADVTKMVKDAHDSGKLLIGSRSVARGLKSGKISHVVLASNCPEGCKKEVASAGGPKVDVIESKSDSVRLGETCGKPFTVLMVGIVKK